MDEDGCLDRQTYDELYSCTDDGRDVCGRCVFILDWSVSAMSDARRPLSSAHSPR
jgi:hypothetical protein